MINEQSNPMEKLPPWYSPKNLHFATYKYECIAAKQLVVCASDLLELGCDMHLVELYGNTYWVFTTNTEHELN